VSDCAALWRASLAHWLAAGFPAPPTRGSSAPLASPVSPALKPPERVVCG